MGAVFIWTDNDAYINANEIVSAVSWVKPGGKIDFDYTQVRMRNGDEHVVFGAPDDVLLSAAPIIPAAPGCEILIAREPYNCISVSHMLVGWRQGSGGLAPVSAYGLADLDEGCLGAIRLTDGRVHAFSGTGDILGMHDTAADWLECARNQYAAKRPKAV